MFFKYVLKMCLIFVMFLDLGLNRIHLPGFTKAWNVPESSMKGFQWSVPKHQRNNKYVADSSGDHQILMDENSWLKVVFARSTYAQIRYLKILCSPKWTNITPKNPSAGFLQSENRTMGDYG